MQRMDRRIAQCVDRRFVESTGQEIIVRIISSLRRLIESFDDASISALIGKLFNSAVDLRIGWLARLLVDWAISPQYLFYHFSAPTGFAIFAILPFV